MAVSMDEVIDDSGSLAIGLEQRRAQFRRRRMAIGIRELISLAATGAIAVWICVVVVISISSR